jgi:hypothetical protein
MVFRYRKPLLLLSGLVRGNAGPFVVQGAIPSLLNGAKTLNGKTAA